MQWYEWVCARIIAFANLLYILIASFVASAVECALRADESVDQILKLLHFHLCFLRIDPIVDKFFLLSSCSIVRLVLN